MKNQYFGDVNDYLKYGVLRALSGRGAVSLAVCWMLTPDDGRSDGNLIKYLQQPEQWRHYDPELYDALRERVLVQEMRDVGWAEEAGLLPGARFHTAILPNDARGRAQYFESFWRGAQGCKLVFCDPDNGMGVRSKPHGRKGSSKYLYWHELEAGWERGHSVLVYQHFRREKRAAFIERMAEQMRDRVKAPVAYSFRTAHAVFLLLPKQDHLAELELGISAVRAGWSGQIEVAKHGRPCELGWGPSLRC